jgi:hypothetical protein
VINASTSRRSDSNSSRARSSSIGVSPLGAVIHCARVLAWRHQSFEPGPGPELTEHECVLKRRSRARQKARPISLVPVEAVGCRSALRACPTYPALAGRAGSVLRGHGDGTFGDGVLHSRPEREVSASPSDMGGWRPSGQGQRRPPRSACSASRPDRPPAVISEHLGRQLTCQRAAVPERLDSLHRPSSHPVPVRQGPGS